MLKRLLRFRVAVGFFVAAAFFPPAQAQPIYRLTDLSTPSSSRSEAFDINDAGQIVGAETFPGGRFATLFNPITGNARIGGTNSVAFAINDRPGGGLIVGQSRGHAALFAFNRVIDLGTLGGAESEARDINNAGDIVGVADLRGGADRATLFGNNPIDPGPNINLGTLGGRSSRAFAINNDCCIGAPPITPGEPGPLPIVGSSTTPRSFFEHAALFGIGQIIDLGTLGGRPGTVEDFSQAVDINDAGQIVGSAFTPGGREVRAAVLFGNNPINPGPNIRLGSLGGDDSVALAINDQPGGGLIVGQSNLTPMGRFHATLWGFGGQVIDLNTRIDPNDPLFGRVELLSAQGINDSGAIVANGLFQNRTRAFLLTPVP